ncbi:LuxR family maltose regulon positive regulatory protein [Marinobacter pelagius]|uniref:LuxR family maltose regulon positive regulatory protein n=1 Tax=Marinobacter pelagius TaxID=379482 RepID=A0A366G8B2_9GAMM|nr:LuxR C-terminal-related transcriptional regulator [Marinobacter pelagius]RBP22179.1 LuxR family maltose regulon positive regulatory protein [Marinobacter pelagius]
MLLTTKFLRPSSDPRAVPRDRLRALLDPAGPKRLDLVIAPAGFGKTTLVSQWCARTSSPTAWLSLDEHDGQPRRFWHYVIGAFEYAGLPGMAQCHKLLAQEDKGDPTAVITALINELARDGGAWALVLDDYHFIQDDTIHRQLAWFIDYLPPGVLVCLASRTEPPLPLARWRVRRWVEDIHPGLLAFSEQECGQFFRDTMGLDITDEDARTICRKTEGWVAAMQLSALSGDNSISREGLAKPAGNLEVDERHISDYVLTEVLDKQPSHLADFLLETSCCPRLNASLCNSIRGRDDSQEILEELLRQNLFLIPLDNHNGWFRYHDLFRDALSRRMQHTQPELAESLWRKTVDWLLAHGHVQEAIAQIVRHQDWPWLARVLSEHGNNLIHGGFHLPVLDWLGALPEHLLSESPQLQMLKIWGLFFANRVDSLEPLLVALEDLLDRRVADSHPDAEGALGLHSEISLIRSYLARSRSDDKAASDLTRRVLEEIDHTRIPLKSVTYYGIALDGFGRGELPEAEDALRSAVHYGQVERKPSTVLSSGGLLAWIQYNRGDIDLALETCTEIRRWVDRHYADPSQPRLISCWQNSALTEIYRERNEPELARSHLAPLLEHVSNGTEPGQHVVIQYVRGHLAFSESRFQDAIETLEDAWQTSRKRRDHIVFEPPASAALLARCFLAEGHPEKAASIMAATEGEHATNPLNREQLRISQARVLKALGKPENALECLVGLRETASRHAHNRHLVEILLVSAEAEDLLGQARKANALLNEALELASGSGFVRLFGEESPRIREMLLDLPALRTPGSWNRRVLHMLRELESTRVAHEKQAARPSVGQQSSVSEDNGSLVEPLSQREMEVLALINEGLANKDIASKMEVAPATVKAHIRNLYGKLAVGRRTEALARARELGLLES